MPKDIRLPNGTLILNVPDDMKKHQISQRAISEGLATNKDFGYDEVTDEDVDGTFLEGMGAGMMNVARRATNLALPDSLTPEFATDEKIEEQTELDKYMTFGHGGGGKMTGELIATAPLGMGVGGGVAKGAAAMGARSMLPKAIAGTLGRGVGRAAVEGATYGGVMADPGEGASGALTGAAFGGTLGAAGRMLGKVAGKGSLVQITREAKQLQKLTGTFIPLSQSAEVGMTRMVYNAFLANIPGVGGKVRGQYQHALNDMRKFVSEHALPDTAKVHNLVKLTGRETVDELVTKMGAYWNVAFDGIKKLPVVGLKHKTPAIPASLTKALKSHGNFVIPQQGKTMTGSQVLELKTAIGEIIPTLGAQQRGKVIAYSQQIDDLLRANFDPTGKGKGAAAASLTEYFQATKYYTPWQAFKKAANTADDLSEFGAGQLAKTAKAGTGSVLPKSTHANPLATQRRAGQLGVKALEDFPSKQGLFQTLAATAPVTSVVGTGLMGGGGAAMAAAFPMVIALGRLGASKGLQRYLSGQTTGQRLGKVLMRKYSQELQRLGATARQAAQILGVEQDAS